MPLDQFIEGTVASIRNDPYTAAALCVAITCKLTPEQLQRELKTYGGGSNTKIDNWLDNRQAGNPSVRWISYTGKLMGEIFRESQIPNYGELINRLRLCRSNSLRNALRINQPFFNKNYQFAADLQPRLFSAIDEHMNNCLDNNDWHLKWTSKIYDLFGSIPGNERFTKFNKLSPEFGSAAGLEICTEQTFGVEIEITTTRTFRIVDINDPQWRRVALQLIEVLISAVGIDKVHPDPLDYHEELEEGQYVRWKIEADSSVGWEIVSPVLRGIDGVFEVKKILDQISIFLSEHDFLCINHRCGLHLNLETPITTQNEWQKFLSRYIRIEPGLFPLLAPARIFKYRPLTFTYDIRAENAYCPPISTNQDRINSKFRLNIEEDNFEDDRYSGFHFKRINGTQGLLNLLEVRIHNGTSHYLAVIAWLALWMKILNHFTFPEDVDHPSCYNFTETNEFDDDFDGENIFEILNSERVIINKRLSVVLRDRRKLMRNLWSMAAPNKVKLWDGAGFYE